MSSVLNSLKFVTAKRLTQLPAVQIRRNKLCNKLNDQIKLAQAMRDKTTYTPMQFRSIRDQRTNEIMRVEVPKRIRQWWFTSENGKMCVQIRYGSKTLDISGKNKTAIEVDSSDGLIKVLELIKTAVESGDLDSQLETAGLKLRKGFTKPSEVRR